MALGQLRMPLNGWQYFIITGGPFMECPDSMRGVKMAAEIHRPCTVDIPTIDFETPDPMTLAVGLTKAVDLVLAGEPLYVGCMGGRGRTGLFLAVLAKAFGVPNPVEYVRQHYYAHAVETDDQYEFVTTFRIPERVTARITQKRWGTWLRFWRRNWTQLPVPDPSVKKGKPVDEPVAGGRPRW